MTFILLLMAFAQGEPPPEAVRAQIEQVDLPAWAARAETARRQADARRAFFQGTTSFAEAFPDLAGTSLGNRTVLRGRLVSLDERATRRESERLSTPPHLPDDARPLLKRRDEALDAEEQADALLRKLLTRLLAALERHPELRDEVLDVVLAPSRDLLHRPLPADPDQARAASLRAAEAADAIRRTEGLRRSILLHLVGNAPLPSPDPDLPPKDVVAASRLWMLVPHLDGNDRNRVDEAIRRVAAVAENGSAPSPRDEPLDEDALRRRLAAIEEERARILTELEILPEGHPAAQPRRATLGALDAEAEALTRTRDALADARVDQAAAAAAQARLEAERAAAEARGKLERLRAELLDRAADARERSERLTHDLDDRQRQLDEDEAALRDRIEAWREQIDTIERASPLPGTGPDPDAVYDRIRDVIDAIADGEVARGDAISFAEERLAEVRVRAAAEREDMRPHGGQPPLMEPLRAWEDALRAEEEVAEELLALAHRERARRMDTLRELTSLRRRLRPRVSTRQLEIDNRRLLAEIGRELTLIRPTLLGSASTRLTAIVRSPLRLLRDGRLVLDLLGSLFWTILLVAGWYWARGKANDLAGRLVWQVRRIRPDLRPIDLGRAKSPLAVVVRAGIDLGLGYLMIGRLSWISGEIAFLVECWLLLAIYRFFMGTFELLVVRSPEFRPALVTLAPAMYDLARRSAQVAVIWSIARGFTSYVVWGMLGLDATNTLLMALFNVAAYLLAGWLLYRWDPLLRERIRARNQESRVVRLLSHDVPWVLRPLSALAMLLFFATIVAVDVGYWALARDRTGIGQLFNVISRYQMAGEQDHPHTPLDPELRQALVEADRALYVQRPGLDDAIDAVFRGWEAERRRGMAALIGDRGDGKRTEVDRFLERMQDRPSVRRRLDTLMTDPTQLVAWLAELAEVEPTDDPDTLVERLRERPRTIFVIEQAHRCFSRVVGGFEGVSTLLYVLNATSDHHFWLVTFHRPGWRYLASIPSLVDVGVFREVINLEPFTPAALRELAERRVGRQGLRLDYRTLMRGTVLGADPEVELERATDTFYRLLTDASEGNPRVAMHLLVDCLEPGDDRTLRVHRRKALATDVIEDVSVYALFALVALRQQDTMGLRELVEVTNLPEAMLRNIVRDLQSRGLVAAQRGLLYVPIQHLARVTRTLRRRHLLYLGA